MTDGTQMLRSVQSVLDASHAVEGDGMPVRRSFPNQALADVDPFLLLDHFGPVDIKPGGSGGIPDHPHRGFETVTYILEGHFEHRDSTGNAGVMRPGDVQWMTAGSGIIHSEMPEEAFRRVGGRLEGLQLWVNLPRADKMMRPRYQHIAAEAMPTAVSDDGGVSVKVIAGESLGVGALIDTRVPIQYLHFTIEPGKSVTQPIGQDDNAFAYILRGTGAFGSGAAAASEGQAVLFGAAGNAVMIATDGSAAEALSVLVLSAPPLNEPVARYGPFVMNTRDEIDQAINDYNDGRLVQSAAE